MGTKNGYAVVERQGDRVVIKDGAWDHVPEQVWFGRIEFIESPEPGATHPGCPGIMFVSVDDNDTPDHDGEEQVATSLIWEGTVLTINRTFEKVT